MAGSSAPPGPPATAILSAHSPIPRRTAVMDSRLERKLQYAAAWCGLVFLIGYLILFTCPVQHQPARRRPHSVDFGRVPWKNPACGLLRLIAAGAPGIY